MGTPGPNDPATAFPVDTSPELAVALPAPTGVYRTAMTVDTVAGHPLLRYVAQETTSGSTHANNGGDLFLLAGDVADPNDATTNVDIWSYVTGSAVQVTATSQASARIQAGGVEVGGGLSSMHLGSGIGSSGVEMSAGSEQVSISLTVAPSQTANAMQIVSSDMVPLLLLTPAGELELAAVGTGVILKSANGSRWRLTVGNTGTVSAVAVT